MKRPPDKTKEYVLVYDCTNYYNGYPEHGKENTVPQDTVVVGANLEERPGSLVFTVKETGLKCQTQYGYMLAENTPESLTKLAQFREIRAAYQEMETRLKDASANLDTVLGPYEGYRIVA